MGECGAQIDRSAAFTHVSPMHARALAPEVVVVEGMRGAGKSFWWTHLASQSHQEMIKATYPAHRFEANLKISHGFGSGLKDTVILEAKMLSNLLEEFPPRSIWRAVLAYKVGFGSMFTTLSSWKERVAWVDSHMAEFDAQLEMADLQLEANGITQVILFDALDRMADNWEHVNLLTRALLQVALETGATRRIRFKVFLCPEILKDRTVISFPHAAKLLACRAELTWRRADIYALFFQCLANSEHGGLPFRTMTAHSQNLMWMATNGIWILPAALKSDEKFQELTFHKLTGSTMGLGSKHGKPYAWLVNHLQDGYGKVSPKSFLTALSIAATATSDQHDLTLDCRAIRIGAQKASHFRVMEITEEDYPWVDLVMKPLHGKLRLPCTVEEFERIWDQQSTIKNLEVELKQGNYLGKLPPQHLVNGAKGVLHDLEVLGILQRMTDQRIQMPEVFRIVFGFGRRGGVKPIQLPTDDPMTMNKISSGAH